MENLDWLYDTLGEFSDDYILLDCPGSSRKLFLFALYKGSNRLQGRETPCSNPRQVKSRTTAQQEKLQGVAKCHSSGTKPKLPSVERGENEDI